MKREGGKRRGGGETKKHQRRLQKLGGEDDSFFVETLKSLAECPICMEIPRSGKFYLCQNSHSICEDCYNKLDSNTVGKGVTFVMTFRVYCQLGQKYLSIAERRVLVHTVSVDVELCEAGEFLHLKFVTFKATITFLDSIGLGKLQMTQKTHLTMKRDAL